MIPTAAQLMAAYPRAFLLRPDGDIAYHPRLASGKSLDELAAEWCEEEQIEQESDDMAIRISTTQARAESARTSAAISGERLTRDELLGLIGGLQSTVESVCREAEYHERRAANAGADERDAVSAEAERELVAAHGWPTAEEDFDARR